MLSFVGNRCSKTPESMHYSIGILNRVFPRYCSSLFPGEKILDFMNLPRENREKIEKAATWYPLREVRLSRN
jgi:hypothetical protein